MCCLHRESLIVHVIIYTYLSKIQFTGEYPDYIDIEKQIVTFLSYENGDVFCTAVMISKDKGACVYDCVHEFHSGANIYALVEKEGHEERVPIKLKNIPCLYLYIVTFEVSTSTEN